MKSHHTKKLIVKTLIQLMDQSDLKDIFVKDIAEKSNITRQTFYRHFKDKYDVINWYYDQEVETLFTSMSSIEGIHRNLIIKLNKFQEELVFFRNAYDYNGQNSLSKHEFQRIYHTLSAKCQQNTQDSLELKYSIEFFCHGVIQMTTDWINQSCPISSQQLADILMKLMPADVKTKLNFED